MCFRRHNRFDEGKIKYFERYKDINVFLFRKHFFLFLYVYRIFWLGDGFGKRFWHFVIQSVLFLVFRSVVVGTFYKTLPNKMKNNDTWLNIYKTGKIIKPISIFTWQYTLTRIYIIVFFTIYKHRRICGLCGQRIIMSTFIN